MYGSDILAGIEKTLTVTALAAGFSLLVFFVLKATKAITGKEISNAFSLCLVAFVFGTLALVTGMITGASRSAAVGQILPAALGLIGAVALHVITKAEAEISVTATAVTAFSLLLLLGTVLGSYERVRAAAYQESQRYDLQRLKTQTDIEFVINGYRRSRGLEPVEFAR